MKKVKLLLMAGFVVTLGMIGCKKGDTGPAGATGPAGPDSVVYSAWIPLSPSYVALTDSTGYQEDTIAAPSVTQGILDSGVILTYLNLAQTGSAAEIVPISGLESSQIQEEFQVGMIIIDSYQYDVTDLPFRYVTIPGSKLEGNGAARKYNGYTIKELKSMTYQKLQTVSGN